MKRTNIIRLFDFLEEKENRYLSFEDVSLSNFINFVESKEDIDYIFSLSGISDNESMILLAILRFIKKGDIVDSYLSSNYSNFYIDKSKDILKVVISNVKKLKRLESSFIDTIYLGIKMNEADVSYYTHGGRIYITDDFISLGIKKHIDDFLDYNIYSLLKDLYKVVLVDKYFSRDGITHHDFDIMSQSYIKYFRPSDTDDIFLESVLYKFDKDIRKDERTYYFDSDKFTYRIKFIKKDNSLNTYYFGFRAKKIGDFDISYDMDVITNDDFYSIKKTIIDILEYDYDNYKPQNYIFSTFETKKGNQRKNLYLNILNSMNWIYKEDKKSNQILFRKK